MNTFVLILQLVGGAAAVSVPGFSSHDACVRAGDLALGGPFRGGASVQGVLMDKKFRWTYGDNRANENQDDARNPLKSGCNACRFVEGSSYICLPVE